MEETPQPNIIKLEAPEYLEPEQNFYQQPPFNEILEDAALQTGIQIEALRRALTSTSRHDIIPYFSAPSISSQDLSREMQAEHNPSLRRILDNIMREARGPKRDKYKQALKIIGKGLEEHLDWNEYIVTQSKDAYNNDGSRKLGSSPFSRIYPQTYARWVKNRINRAQLAQLQGIQDSSP